MDAGRPQEFKAPVQLRLSTLWAAAMFCYVYGDFFGLFVPGRLARMNGGNMDPVGTASPLLLLGGAIMMAIPALMIVLSLVLPPTLDRWTNVVLGLVYTAIMLLTMLPGGPPFYLFLGLVEMALTLAVVVSAWRWPRGTLAREGGRQADRA